MDRGHIRTKNLSVSYGKHIALSNVSIDIPQHKITAIIGPSGCGKSTLLKVFNRLLELNDDVKISGEVFVDDLNIYEKRTDVYGLRKKMGLLAQKPFPLPMSIYENVAYGLRIHNNIDKKKLGGLIEHYLREANLWDEVKDRLHASASKLSIGQQQRLCLARGLAIEPEIILGDEPTSALDPFSAERIEKKLIELKTKYTIVIVTHNIQQAMKLADYVVFLYHGSVVEADTADKIFKTSKKLMTQAYIKGEYLDEIWVQKEARLIDKVSGGAGI
jgi:phosphate transport system ATP-binding protein